MITTSACAIGTATTDIPRLDSANAAAAVLQVIMGANISMAVACADNSPLAAKGSPHRISRSRNRRETFLANRGPAEYPFNHCRPLRSGLQTIGQPSDLVDPAREDTVKRSKALGWLSSAFTSVTRCAVFVWQFFTPEYRVFVPVRGRSDRRVRGSR